MMKSTTFPIRLSKKRGKIKSIRSTGNSITLRGQNINDFKLDILGTSFTITVDEDPEYLEEILEQYRETIESTKKMFALNNPLVTAILSGFLLSDELARLKASEKNDSQKAEEQFVEDMTNDMIARIDGVLEGKAAAQP
jgi:cell division protein ZapA (FtsZ GTPase activity inhibitor)